MFVRHATLDRKKTYCTSDLQTAGAGRSHTPPDAAAWWPRAAVPKFPAPGTPWNAEARLERKQTF